MFLFLKPVLCLMRSRQSCTHRVQLQFVIKPWTPSSKHSKCLIVYSGFHSSFSRTIDLFYHIYPFFDGACFLILSHLSSLSVLDTNPLSVSSFTYISSWSVGCLFIFFMISSAVQKLLTFVWSYLLFLKKILSYIEV